MKKPRPKPKRRSRDIDVRFRLDFEETLFRLEVVLSAAFDLGEAADDMSRKPKDEVDEEEQHYRLHTKCAAFYEAAEAWCKR